MSKKIIPLFMKVAEDYFREQKIEEFSIHQEHDIHAFYRLSNEPSKVIHVQGYPGMSTGNETRISARIMDYDKLIEIRRTGNVSVGNEHEAIIKSLQNFKLGIVIPYDSKILEKKLADNIPELK